MFKQIVSECEELALRVYANRSPEDRYVWDAMREVECGSNETMRSFHARLETVAREARAQLFHAETVT